MEKRSILILYENNHYITPSKKNCFFLDICFFFCSEILFFYFTLEVEGVFFFLMASYLHKKFQGNELILLCMDYDVRLG